MALERLLRVGDEAAAYAYAERLAGIYDEHTCLSLELHQPGDHAIAQKSVAIGQRLGLPCAAVQPVYCLGREEAARLKLLAAIDCNCPLDEVPPSALPARGDSGVDLHWLSPFDCSPVAVSVAQRQQQMSTNVANCISL